MKSMIVLALTLVSISSFAQGPVSGAADRQRPGQYDPGTKGNPYPQNVQIVSVQPGTSTYIQAFVPTQVICENVQQYPQPRPQPQPQPQQPSRFKTVEFYASDRCDGGFLSTINFTGIPQQDSELCRIKAAAVGSTQVWGIKVNGQCINISDTNFASACIGAM